MRGAWIRRLAAAVLVGLAAVAATAARADGPALGDPAPALDVVEWVKGGPADLAAFKDKNVVLLDFFNVNWKDEYLAGHVKRLNELQDKHGGAGLKVVALSTNTVEDVKKYVAGHEFKCTVGIDNMKNTIGAFGGEEPPMALLLDKQGRMVWKGALEQVDKTLEKLVAGKFDLEHVKKREELKSAMVAEFNTQDPEKIEPRIDALLAHDPNALWIQTNVGPLNVKRWCLFKQENAKGWREWIAKHVAKMTEPDALNELAWDLVTDDALAWREASAALAAATKAVDLKQGKEAAMIDTLARVYYEIGLVDRAIETQQKAIAALEPTATEAEKKQYQEILGYYQACAALGKTVKPDVRKPDPKKKP